MRFLRKTKVTKTILVISDIHLGAGVVVEGKRNPLEDFHHDKEMVGFIEYYFSGEYLNRDVELIINGDLFDFLAVPYVKYFDDEYWSEEASVEKLKMMINAHREVVDALVKFSSCKKKKLVYIIGNHDAEMILPAVKKHLEKFFTKEGKKYIKIIIDNSREYTPAKGIVLKHGHEYETPHHFHHKNSIVLDDKGRRYFLPPWGSYYVTRVINKFKEERNHVNTVRPVKKFIINGLIYDTLFTLRFIFSNIFYFFMVRFIYFYKLKIGYKRIMDYMKSELELFGDYEHMAKIFFKKRKDASGLIVGHTHEPIFRNFSEGRFFINTGTWVQMHHLDFVRQKEGPMLTYAQIDIKTKEETPCGVSLNIWRGKDEYPFCEF